MDTPLRVGIVGCGTISDSYLRMANFFKDYQVIACADINPASAQSRADEFNIEARSLDALFNADDIDIIVNLTIPSAHFEVSRAALVGGKHVYSEKPYILQLEQGKILAELAQQKGLRIGSAPDTFLGGSHQQGRTIIDSGDIGDISSGTVFIMNHGMESWHPNPDFFFQAGGGPVLDLGPYYLSNLVQLLGPISHVKALSSTPSVERTIGNGPRCGEKIAVTTPTTIHALLQFESGTLINFGASWDVWAHEHNPIELYGSLGSLYLPDPNFFGGEVKVTQHAQAVVTPAWQHPFSIINDRDKGGVPRANYRGVGLADMALAIKNGTAHRCNQEFALHIIDVLNCMLDAAQGGQNCEISTRCDRPLPLSIEQANSLIA